MTRITIRFSTQYPNVTCTAEEYTPDIAGAIVIRGRFKWLYPWHTIASIEAEELEER